MSLLGIHLTILAGPIVPVPVPPDVVSRVRSVTVTESDRSESAFTIVLDAGRSGPLAIFDTPALGPPLRVNSRVVVVLTIGVIMQVLADGIITEASLTPGGDGRAAELRLTGRDASLLMDRREVSTEHVGLSDQLQVAKIVAQYATHRILLDIVPSPTSTPPPPTVYVPTQQETDWGHIVGLARRLHFDCYMRPGPVPGVSTVYWGPPQPPTPPQPALSVDLGPDTNVHGTINFSTDVLGPERIEGWVRDADTNMTLPVEVATPARLSLSALPTWTEHFPDVRIRQYRDSGPGAMAALARALGRVNESAVSVTATGSLDGVAYGGVLRPRGMVGLRGAGWSHDGTWYVRQVVHHVTRGAYTADFTLSRDGAGAVLPVVRV